MTGRVVAPTIGGPPEFSKYMRVKLLKVKAKLLMSRGATTVKVEGKLYAGNSAIFQHRLWLPLHKAHQGWIAKP